MKIKLNGFRSHVDTEFEFPENVVTLLKGPSGIGKSTIFAAISWVLYGSMQFVYNNTGATNKCSVTLEFNQPRMIIYRQKRPELLRITLFTEGEEVKYEDRVAQQIIDQSFGTKDVWTSCCYLAQFSRSYLLSASNSDKTELLNNLSFTAEDPELYINRIEAELNRINQEFSTKQGIFTNECNRFGEEIAKANLDMNLFLSPADQEDLKNKLKELKSSYEDLKRQNLIDQQARGAKSALEKRKESLVRNLATLPAINEEKIAQLESQLEVLQIEGRSVPHLLQASRIRKELETLAKEEEKLKPVNLEELQINKADLEEARITQLTIQKQKYDEAIALVKRLNIAYNKTAIDEEIQTINQQLEMQPKIQMFISIAEIQNKLNLLQQSIKENVYFGREPELDLEIQALRDKIDHLKMAVGVLKCPHCTKPVRMIKGALTPSDTDPPSPARIGECEKRLQDLTTTRQKILEMVPLKQKLEMLMGMVDQLPEIIPKALTPIEINRLKQRMNDLTRINIIEAPTLDPQELRKIKNLLKSREQLLERKERLQSELAQIPVEGENIDPVTHQNRVDQVKRDLTQIRNQKEKRLILEQQIEDITAQWKEISFDDTLTQRMTEMSKEIEDADFHLKTAQKIDLLVDQQNKLEKEKTNLEELYTYLTDLQRLRTIALEVEGHALQETIDSINNVLSDIASTLFDKDREMSIRLSAFKQLKTKDRIKPMINLGIKYGNGEYDNVNQLSGGEGDRISLAITLALSRLNTCPLLLLDECMASLDADLKEVCLGAIRDAVGGTKTVIIINHEGTEGHYDHVVQLDD